MAKADTKDRIGHIELLDQFDADASVFGSSWSWREDDEGWIELLIVSMSISSFLATWTSS